VRSIGSRDEFGLGFWKGGKEKIEMAINRDKARREAIPSLEINRAIVQG
jgi:hypothetical protein